MNGLKRWMNGLERRGLKPSYAGGLLLVLAIFLFAAATNTLAGWLYVMSGIMLALLALATRLPRRQLQGVGVERLPIEAVSAGDPLWVEMRIINRHRQPRSLFQVVDTVAPPLGRPQATALRSLAPEQTFSWRYPIPTTQRGIYHWDTLALRSATPLGLFWYRRDLSLPATAVVYPQVLSLQRCPILDPLGNQAGQQWQYHPVVKPATEGITRSLRPYRWGDPTRLIHWRTSARYGELRVRELEKVTASQEVVIALNTRGRWAEAGFEQAVVAAASLYHYALGKGLAAALWIPQSEVIQDRPGVLMALAGVQVDPSGLSPQSCSGGATIWLTPSPLPMGTLGPGSRQLVWSQPTAAEGSGLGESPLDTVVWIQPDQPLQAQLQTQTQFPMPQPAPTTASPQSSPDP